MDTSWIVKTIAGVLILAVLSWAGLQLLKIDRIDYNLSTQSEKLTAINEQVESMRVVFRDYLLDDKPDKKALIRRLAQQQPIPLYIGMQDFVEGNYKAAFGRWVSAAQSGDKESQTVAETALFKLYQKQLTHEPLKYQMAAGVLGEIIRSPQYDLKDPKVAKFHEYLHDFASASPTPKPSP